MAAAATTALDGASSGELKRGRSEETGPSTLKGGGGNEAKLAPEGSDLALAQTMHSYMLELRSSEGPSLRVERGAFACALKRSPTLGLVAPCSPLVWRY